mgnify:CR=1 FL=1
MNAQEFKAHMQLISVQAREDIEAAHIEADDLLCNQLSELGYTEGIKNISKHGKILCVVPPLSRRASGRYRDRRG